MLASFLMGLVGGQRGLTPLATVAVAGARGELSPDNGGPRWLSHPLVAAGLTALAAAEYAGDKQKTAPDRIVPIGLAVRFVTSAIAGAALTTKDRRWAGAAVGGATAVIASFPGWRLRVASMLRYGQTVTGFAEEAIVLAAAAAIVRSQARARIWPRRWF